MILAIIPKLIKIFNVLTAKIMHVALYIILICAIFVPVTLAVQLQKFSFRNAILHLIHTLEDPFSAMFLIHI